MEAITDDLIKDILSLPFHTKFINIDSLEPTNYFRLFVDLAKEHVMSFNKFEGMNRQISNVMVKIIDDRENVNGYSFFHEGINVICIKSSIIIKLMNLSLRFAEHPKFFPNIGHVPEAIYSEKEKPIVKDKKINYLTTIEDETRRDMAFLVFYFGCVSLIYHEIGHLIHGHTLLGTKNGYEFLSILDMSDKENDLDDDKKCLDRQTVEMDADAYASSHIWYTLENFYPNRSKWKGAFINSKKIMCKIFICSVSIFFVFLHNENPKKTKDITKYNHLPTYYRLVLAIDSIRTTINEINTDFITYDEMSNFAFEESLRCIDIYKQIYPGALSVEEFKAIIKQESIAKQYKRIKGNWNSLHDLLNEFSYVNLPSKYNCDELNR